MARKVFFSFHYQRDLWRVNVVRNSGMIDGVSAAGFYDASLWERAKRSGAEAVKTLINDGLEGTTVTAVLIGAETAKRQYVSYEIERSIALGNGLLGIRINNIKDAGGLVDSPGLVPESLIKAGAPVYTYEYGKLAGWIETAYAARGPN
jgi:antiphage defense system Thoeris ThsB-like protein